MSKKKAAETQPTETQLTNPGSEGKDAGQVYFQHSLRFAETDADLLHSLDHYRAGTRQSRNAAILSLLEECLRGKGKFRMRPGSTSGERSDGSD